MSERDAATVRTVIEVDSEPDYDVEDEADDLDDDVSELSRVAIQVILCAGDGKVDAENALKALHSFDFDRAEELLKSANGHIVDAHNHQTSIIQREAAGEKFENSIIFNHAQDTLMTAMTQVSLSREICALFRLLYERMVTDATGEVDPMDIKE